MVKCCVDGCKITSKKDVTYFKFPASRSLRQKWEAALKISGKKLNGASVCNRHFTAEDYDLVRGKMRLKAAVVPTVFAMEVINNSTNNIPNDEELTDKTKDLSPEREEERDPDKDKTESNDSPINNTSPEDPTLDTDTLPNKDVSPTRESSPQKDRFSISNEEIPLETDISIDKDMSPVNDTLNTNGVTETVEEDLSKDKLDPEKDIKDKIDSDEKDIKDKIDSDEKDIKDKIDSDEKDICDTNISNNLDSSCSKPSDINKDLSATEKEDSAKGENEAKTTESIDNKNENGSIDENQDIEELLTDYRIYQNNIHRAENEITVEIEPESEMETYDGDLPHNADPVFIELAVDKESANDCLMVMESVQVEIDPSTLLEHQEFEVASDDLDGDDDVTEVGESQGPKEPISLLTSSDEDDVILEEPKIDTVEVSDETDEDDKPLVQLVKKKKKKKKVKRTPYRVDTEIRKRIIQLRNDGLPITDIANEVGVTRNTVYLWLERWKKEGALNSHVSFGRPRSTTKHQDMAIVNIAKEEKLVNKTQILANLHQVSRSTIRRRLREGGVQNKSVTKKNSAFLHTSYMNYDSMM